MQRWKNILYNTSFALNCLLGFLLIFEERLWVPAWLQTVGRMHPLFLHFPIVLILLCIFWEAVAGFKKQSTAETRSIGDGLLLVASLSTVSTALMGLLLSKEGGYTQDVVAWHKWGGIIISLLSLAWYGFRDYVRRSRVVLTLTGVSSVILILITGHQGANITHGEDFLFAPLTTGEQTAAVLFEEAEVYAHLVQPIFKAKCISCHNPQKAKGELVMEPVTALLKGGKSGPLWDSTQKDFGLMMTRIHLPPDNKKHMPPAGKPQLTAEEERILYHWLRNGAGFTTKVLALPQKDSLRIIAASLFKTIETGNYTFEPADEKKVKALNTNYRLVSPLAVGSPALTVEFFGAAQFRPEHLKELAPIKTQVVSLNLNKMPVKDDDLKLIAEFVNLRKLNLSFTDIKGPGLSNLGVLKELRQLSLSGTGVTATHLAALASMSKLSQLFIWSTPAQNQNLSAVQKGLKNTSIETGFTGDTIIIKLNPPTIENTELIVSKPVPLKLKHTVKGVNIYYTTDGTEPDSVKSPLYKGDVMIDTTITVKVKAFKPGWISSNVQERSFFKAGYKPDSAWLLQPTTPKFASNGVATLTDAEKGDLQVRFAKWLGYQNNTLEAVFFYKEPPLISSVLVSSMVDIYSHVLPAQQVQIWAGNDLQHLRLLKKVVPEQPAKHQNKTLQSFHLRFTPMKATYYKLVMVPAKVPAWLDKKRPQGWAFVDEVFFK